MAVVISVIVTVILVLLTFYVVFGLNIKPKTVMSVACPVKRTLLSLNNEPL